MTVMLRTPKADLVPVVSAEKRADADAAVDREIRLKNAELERNLRKRDADDQRAQNLKAADTADRENRRAKASAWAHSRVDYCRRESAAAWSAIVYTLAVGTAVYGQINIAINVLHWPLLAGIGVAGFVEGLALSMALTAHQLRMQGERALLAVTLTWVAASFASGVNGYAHKDNPVECALLAAASFAGITVWEIRTGARNRAELREKGIIAVPRPRLGSAYWLRFPGRAFWAWTACIAHPAIRTRLEAIEAGVVLRSARRSARRSGRFGWLVRWADRRRSGPNADDLVRMVADQTARPSGWVPVRSADAPLPVRTDADRSVDRRAETRTDNAVRSEAPVRADQGSVRSADQPSPVRDAAADRFADLAVPVRTADADRSGAEAGAADRSEEPRTADALTGGPSADELEPAVRDALPLVRPFAEALWLRGVKINRGSLREEINKAPEDRKIKIENGLLGKISPILRAEMPIPSPEESEVTSQ